MTSNQKRRSIKETFKNILQRKNDNSKPSGNFARPTTEADVQNSIISLVSLPHLISTSTLPDFDSSRYNLNRYSPELLVLDEGREIRPYDPGASQETIRPVKSQLNQAYNNQQLCEAEVVSGRSKHESYEYPHTELDVVSDDDRSRNCYQGSPKGSYGHRKVESCCASLLSVADSAKSNTSKVSSRSPKVRLSSSYESFETVRPVSTQLVCDNPHQDLEWDHAGRSRETLLFPSYHNHRFAEALSSLDHFSSLCVLDGAIEGNPVTATSENMREVLEIGEEFGFDTNGIDGKGFETLTGEDQDGNPTVQLVIYTPLKNVHNGQCRYVIAAFVDISSLSLDAHSLPDLESGSDESAIEGSLLTPPRSTVLTSSLYNLSAEQFSEEHLLFNHNCPTSNSEDQDVWLKIATENEERTASELQLLERPSSVATVTSGTSFVTTGTNAILDNFLMDMYRAYSSFFLLNNSAIDDSVFEIGYTSYQLYQSFIAHSVHERAELVADLNKLELQLTANKPFRTKLNWGMSDRIRSVQCVPLFARRNVTWICFLLEFGHT